MKVYVFNEKLGCYEEANVAVANAWKQIATDLK